MQVGQTSPSFLPNFKTNVNNINAQVDPVAVAMFGNANTNTNNDVIFTQEMANIANATTNQPNMDQSFTHNLMTEAGTTSMNHILSYPSTSPNNQTMMDTSSGSPIAQDVILNSTSVTMNSSPSVSIIPPPIPAPTTGLGGMSSDIILNPTVSPTMMCHSSTDQTNLIAPQASSVLTCHSMPTQNVLNNLMQPIPPANEPIHISRSSPVAVKNMILNAAADILSSRPSNMSAESTIDALISLNSNGMLNEQQTTVPSMMMTQANATVSPNGVLIPNGSEMPSTNLTERICHNSPPLDQRIPMFTTETSPLTSNPIIQNSELTNIVTQQDLINQELRNDQLRRVTQDIITDYQKIQKINNAAVAAAAASQESLLQAVALVRNDMQQTKNGVMPDMQMQPNPIGVGAVVQQQPNTTTAANIPQDIAIMSDNDLIRYINPSCFDQGEFYASY